jgi:hypothetical protein
MIFEPDKQTIRDFERLEMYIVKKEKIIEILNSVNGN